MRDWLIFILLLSLFIAVAVAIGMLMAVWNPSYGAASTACAPPDPRAAPVVQLNAGELRALSALAWAEARGEPDPYCSMQAVAAVVVNRLRTNPRYFGASVTQVITRPNAFSPFGRTDPQYRKMSTVDERDPLYLSALLASIAAVSGADPTRGGTHFHARGVRPGWSRDLLVTARIGNHVFYR